jgi:hypothetical protein
MSDQRSPSDRHLSEALSGHGEPSNLTRKDEEIVPKSSGVQMPAAAPLGIAAIFEQLEDKVLTSSGREQGQNRFGSGADEVAPDSLNANAGSLGPTQLQSATHGCTQMLQLLWNSSSSFPRAMQSGAFSYKTSEVSQLPEPFPLDTSLTKKEEAAKITPGHSECAVPASPFVGAAAAAVATSSPEAEGEPALPTRAQRRVKLQAYSRLKDDTDWELDEDGIEPEWKGPPTRNTKESKVNVRCPLPFILT